MLVPGDRQRLLLIALCLAAAAAQVAIFRWGVILPDTVVQYRQVLSGRYEDWHPPVTAWVWRWIGGARFGSAPILILDAALAWGGIGLFAEGVRRRCGIGWALAAVAIGLWPITYGELGSILKDSLLAAACLAAAGLLGFHSLTGVRGGAWRWVTLALLVLASATRFNAFLATAPLIVAVLLPRLRTWRWAAGVAVAGAMLLIAGSIINGVLLQPVRQRPFLSLVAFDLAGIFAGGGSNGLPFPDATAQAMVGRCYAPAHYNLQDDPGCELEGPIFRTGGNAMAVWARAIAADPLAYARHRLAHFNANQRWLVRDVPEDAVYLMSADNSYGLFYRPNHAALVIGHAAEALARSPLGRPATWLAIAAGLLLVAGALPSAMLVRALAGSAMLYGLGYLVVSVAADMRYNLWTMVATMLALLVAVADRGWRQVPRWRVGLALAPVIMVLVGEIVVMAG